MEDDVAMATSKFVTALGGEAEKEFVVHKFISISVTVNHTQRQAFYPEESFWARRIIHYS